MKKKTTIFITILTFTLFLSLILNSQEVKSEQIITKCTVTEDYMFVEAYANSKDIKSTTTNSSTFDIPDNAVPGGEVTYTVTTSQWTENDCENYVSNMESRQAAGVTDGEAYCDSKDVCTHSNVFYNEDGTKKTSSLNMQEALSNCQAFTENQVQSSAQVSQGDQSKAEGGEIVVDITRENNTNTSQESVYSDGTNDWLFSPIKAEVIIEYDCYMDSEEKEDNINADEPGQACPADNPGSGINASCTDATAEGVIVKQVSTTYQTEYKENDFYEKISKNFCGLSGVKETASANIAITQVGNLSVNMDHTKYSGGGVIFGFKYNVSASWETCGKYKNASCTRTYAYPTCESGYSLNLYSKQCEKYEVNENGITELTDSTDYICKNQTVGGKPSSCLDVNVANSKINAVAGAENDGISKASVKSQDSNDASDKSLHELDGTAGTVYMGSSGAGAFGSGINTENSMSFSLWTACINIYNPFNVEYYQDGNCPENTINGGTRYYIPLKYPEDEGFNFEITSSDISIISSMHWTLYWTCDVTCQQKLYASKAGFKFIYRPIDMSNPFPNREPGTNWKNFMNNTQVAKSKLNRNESGLEYSTTLTVSSISTIKNTISNPYTDLHTITPEGKSTILNSMGIDISGNSTYNNLGKCEKDCW